MPHIAADNLIAVGAVIFALAWLGFWADRHPIARKVSGVPWVLTAALLLSNIGVIPMESPVYGFVGQYLLPLGIPMLLYKANIRTVLTEGARVLPPFLVACVGVSVGAILGFFIFDLGPAGAKVAGTYAGGFIGGVSDFVAVSQAVEMTPTEFTVALGASAPASIVGLLILMALPSLKFVRRHIPSKFIDPANEGKEIDLDGELPRFRLDHIAAAITISLTIGAVSHWISTRLGIANYNLIVITVITVVVVNLLPRQFAKLEGDFALGMLFMYAFFAMIGAGTDAVTFIHSAPILFVYCTFMLCVHFVIALLAARLFRFDLADVVIGSGAAIVGPAAAAGIAMAKGWKAHVTPGIAMGMLGKVIANFIGIAIFRWLS
jgi:uncharacterized membrane protein